MELVLVKIRKYFYVFMFLQFDLTLFNTFYSLHHVLHWRVYFMVFFGLRIWTSSFLWLFHNLYCIYVFWIKNVMDCYWLTECKLSWPVGTNTVTWTWTWARTRTRVDISANVRKIWGKQNLEFCNHQRWEQKKTRCFTDSTNSSFLQRLQQLIVCFFFTPYEQIKPKPSHLVTQHSTGEFKHIWENKPLDLCPIRQKWKRNSSTFEHKINAALQLFVFFLFQRLELVH